MFTSINIETYGYCNRKCSDCFYSIGTRKQGVMETGLVHKILNELGQINFTGRVNLYFFGEPLMDERLPDLTRYAKNKCNHATIRISTNGDFLTDKMCNTLRDAGMDDILITNYEDAQNKTLQKLSEKYDYVRYREHKTIKKTARANIMGKIKGKVNKCVRPENQAIIDWSGNVLLCCQDFLSEFTFGNVNESSLMEIWASEKYTTTRTHLAQNKNRAPYLCQYCTMDR